LKIRKRFIEGRVKSIMIVVGPSGWSEYAKTKDPSDGLGWGL